MDGSRRRWVRVSGRVVPTGSRAHLARHGYLYLPGVFDPQLIASTAESIIRAQERLDVPSEAPGMDRSRVLARGGRLAQDVGRAELLRPLTESESLHELLHRIDDCDWTPLVGNQQALRFVPPGYRITGNPFVTPIHQEASAFQSGCSSPWYVLTVWIPMVPCSSRNGTVAFARGSQTRILKHWRSGLCDLGIAPDRATEKAWSEDPEIHCVFGSQPLLQEHRWDIVDCEPGDAVLFSERIVHAGLSNGSRDPRISLDLRFSPSDGFIRWDQCGGAAVDDFAQQARIALRAAHNEQSRQGCQVRREVLLLAFEHLMAQGPLGEVPVFERATSLISQLKGDMNHGDSKRC